MYTLCAACHRVIPSYANYFRRISFEYCGRMDILALLLPCDERRPPLVNHPDHPQSLVTRAKYGKKREKSTSAVPYPHLPPARPLRKAFKTPSLRSVPTAAPGWLFALPRGNQDECLQQRAGESSRLAPGGETHGIMQPHRLGSSSFPHTSPPPHHTALSPSPSAAFERCT